MNNAGFIRDAMTFSMGEEQFDAVVQVHLKGHFAPSHHAAKYWRGVAKALPEGTTPPARRIVNTTSESGLFAARAGNYGSAKGGIITMTLIMPGARAHERHRQTASRPVPGRR